MTSPSGAVPTLKGKEKESTPSCGRWYSAHPAQQQPEASTSANKLPHTLASMMEDVTKDARLTAADEFEVRAGVWDPRGLVITHD